MDVLPAPTSLRRRPSQGSPSDRVIRSGVASDSDRRPSPLPVVIAGFATTVLALVGVWWLNRNTTDFHMMGWYASYVLPVGALLVGFVAGSGYGLASWWTGLKIRRALLAAVLGLQLAAYVAAEYIEFRDVARAVGVDTGVREFRAYFHLKATSFAWSRHGRTGEPIGMWGYFFIGLAVVGFAAGGVLAPAILSRVAYCERCQMYMRSRRLGTLPASVKARRVSKKNVEEVTAYEAEQRQAGEQAAARLREIAELTAKNDGFGLKATFDRERPGERATWKLPARIVINLVHCRSCLDAHMQPVSWVGHGNQQRQTKLDPIPASTEIVKALQSA